MKLKLVTRLDKRNTAMLKIVDDGVISALCDVIAFFPVYGQFSTILKPDSGRMACNFFILFNSNPLSYKK